MPPKKPKVYANRYEIVKKLGKGNFGTAWLCKDLRCKEKDGSELKVLKEISVGDLAPDETVDAMHEARLLSKLDHPSIVQFHDSFIDGECFCIVTEYCEGGDLDLKINEHKKNKKVFDEKIVMDWFVQLVLAVHYMHSRRVLHRDLKTRNIFLKKNMVKIGDFGISRILMGTTDLASTFTGTPYYMSPEVLKHEGYNSKSDVWSIGCILYEMCALDHAFNGQSLMAVMYKIVEGEPPDLPPKYSKELNKVLKLMLNKDPVKRPSATELIKVPLLSQHIAKMSQEYQSKHNSSHDIDHVQHDTDEIAKVLKSRPHLEELRKDEEDVKLKNLPPRERMRLRKMREADKEAKRMSEVARVQLIANQERKSRIQSTLHTSSTPVWQGGDGEGEKIREAITVRDASEKKKKNFGNRTAPVVLQEVEEKSDFKSSDNFKPLNTISGPLEQHTDPDERPITPMKNRLIYDDAYSSLDFEDGIPAKPDLAETYYSQFEDEFVPSSDEEDEATRTVIEKILHGDDDDDILYGSAGPGDLDTDGTLTNKDDEDVFFNCLQNVLDTDDAENTVTLQDDAEAGAFGPVARETKIKNLRTECQKILGEGAFQKAYDYLKTARYDKPEELTEENIMQGLRQFVKNPSDCFLVDQLLFLEEQHNIS